VAVRAFLPDATQSGEQLALSPDAAAHVTRVLRLAVGDDLRVFNGRGGEWQARVVASSKASVVVAVLEAAAPARETRVRYTMALALLKGDGTDEAIRDVVMIGAAAVCPFVSARSEVSAVAALRASRLERWQRVAVSAATQCGRAVVPEVAAPVTFEAMIAAPADGVRLFFVEPAAGGSTVVLADVPAPAAVTLAIGPEGGWTAEEVASAASAGWRLVSLGGRTLRATSAPLAAVAACQAVWRDE
jgi:16S rRNA (uracil1498-N3)-methyltransferase